MRIFPNDTVANLNAANAAIRRDEFIRAQRYLEKAGDGPEAMYARAALAIRKKDYDSALKYLGKAKDMGLEQAAKTMNELKERRMK